MTRCLLGLLQAAEAQVGHFQAGDQPCCLDRLALAALAEARAEGREHDGDGGGSGSDGDREGTPPAQHAAALELLLSSFGWDGRCFARPPDARCLASRLKACLFDGLTQCGSGSYSRVYSARHRVTGGRVTLKMMKLEGNEEGVPSVAVREISLLRELAGSPYVVQLLDVLWDHSRLYLVMEHCDRDLREHLDREPASRQLPNVKSCMYQLLKAVAFAHAHRVMHRDLKPQNILVDKHRGCIKVADFGLARTFTPPVRQYTHEVVTLLYRAPEILLGAPLYSTPVDVWSLGCILAELITGQPLFYGDSEIGQLYVIFQLLGTPTEAEWPGVSSLPDWQQHFPQWRARDLAQAVPGLDPLGVDLLRQMLCYEPSRRIRCRQALAHPWFDDIREAEEARHAALKKAARQQAMQYDLRRPAWAAAAATAAAQPHTSHPHKRSGLRQSLPRQGSSLASACLHVPGTGGNLN